MGGKRGGSYYTTLTVIVQRKGQEMSIPGYMPLTTFLTNHVQKRGMYYLPLIITRSVGITHVYFIMVGNIFEGGTIFSPYIKDTITVLRLILTHGNSGTKKGLE